jgi:hypothetical protein
VTIVLCTMLSVMIESGPRVVVRTILLVANTSVRSRRKRRPSCAPVLPPSTAPSIRISRRLRLRHDPFTTVSYTFYPCKPAELSQSWTPGIVPSPGDRSLTSRSRRISAPIPTWTTATPSPPQQSGTDSRPGPRAHRHAASRRAARESALGVRRDFPGSIRRPDLHQRQGAARRCARSRRLASSRDRAHSPPGITGAGDRAVSGAPAQYRLRDLIYATQGHRPRSEHGARRRPRVPSLWFPRIARRQSRP